MLFTILSTVLGLLDKVFGYVANVETTKLTEEATVDVAVLQANAEVQKRWWFVALIPPLIAFPFIVYTWQIVLYDKMISKWIGHPHATDALTGYSGWVYTMVIGFYFLHSLSDNK